MPEPNDALPLAAKKWNWGALWLNVFWGLKHNTDFALLTLIPGLGLIVPFILGARGGRWAWRNRSWSSVAEFEKAQRDWALWGWLVVFFLVVGLFLPVRNYLVDRIWERSAVITEAVRHFTDQPDFQKVVGASPRQQVYEARPAAGGRERFRVGLRLEGQEERIKIRLYLMRLEGAWVVYRAVLFHYQNEPGVDYPLPPALLQTGPAAPGANPPRAYDCQLQSVPFGQEQAVAALAADLNHWTPTEAHHRLRQPSARICSGVSWAAAKKLQAKFADYGVVLELTPAQPAP
jgi:hypothetical protein